MYVPTWMLIVLLPLGIYIEADLGFETGFGHNSRFKYEAIWLEVLESIIQQLWSISELPAILATSGGRLSLLNLLVLLSGE